MKTNLKSLTSALLLGALMGLAATCASAGLLETRSNYVGQDWSDSWSNESNWAAITPYAAELGDGLGGEIDQITMANDDSSLYIYFNQGSGFGYDYGNQYIFFDTDLNAATGNTSDWWWWGQSTGGVGAEHTMYGAAIFHAADGAWTGDGVDNWVYGAQYGDIMIKISLAKLGTPTSFNWTARIFGVDDYYPNVGNYNNYTVATGAVPEPGSMLALLSGLVGLAGFGIRRKK